MYNKAISMLVGAAVIVMSPTRALSVTIHVPGDQPSIQHGINAAVNGDEIVVAPGIYFERIDLSGKAITVRSSHGPWLTIINGQRAGSVVTCQSGEGPGTVLEGFTITRGDSSPASGGGLYNHSSSPTVTDCIFTANTATFGGGMFNVNSSPTVTDCTFSGNTALNGGGMCNVNSQPVLTNCTFSGNGATVNPSGGVGGALFNLSFSSVTLTNCTFADNTCNCAAGAIYNADSSLFVLDCTFRGNEGGWTVTLVEGGNATFTNCTFSGNSGGGWTVGAWGTGAVAITNCTFSSNAGGWTVGGTDLGTLTVTNSVFWNNSGENVFGTPAVSFCNVEGGFAGTGNIDVDPMFVNELGHDGIPGTGDEDLRLAADSWCIDAGDSAAVPPGVVTDLNGSPRCVDAVNYPDFGQPDGATPVVDMGAFEAAAGTWATPRAYVFWRHAISGDNTIWMTNGAALLSAAVQPIAQMNWAVAGMGDFDGDGESYDLLWRHQVTGNNSMWLMYGTSQAPGSGPVQAIANTNWTVVGTDDFDGDGRTDVLWRHQVNGKNSVWLMDGTTVRPESGPLPKVKNTNRKVVATGDLDGDGRADIVWRHQGNGKNNVWLMDGTTVLPASGALPRVADTDMAIVGAGDFDGDGRCDLLWRHQVDGTNSIWFMDGTTVLPGSGPLPAVTNTNWIVAGTRDFNGDGRSDILWHHQGNGKNSMWYLDGTTVLDESGPVLRSPDADWMAVASSE